MLGALVALDLFLFYVFWEVMLIPMYFLIGVWGGARRIYAAIKFLLYTMVGSLLMLVAILYLAYLHNAQHGAVTFDLLSLYNLEISRQTQLWLFAAFAALACFQRMEAQAHFASDVLAGAAIGCLVGGACQLSRCSMQRPTAPSIGDHAAEA